MKERAHTRPIPVQRERLHDSESELGRPNRFRTLQLLRAQPNYKAAGRHRPNGSGGRHRIEDHPRQKEWGRYQ